MIKFIKFVMLYDKILCWIKMIKFVKFYDTNKNISDFNSKDDMEMIRSTSKLYDWCINNNITIKILSDVNPCDKRFTRINSINNI